ncbi:hypothetical protein V1525DRAFT_265929 [Lipomyces kononenkoae]|uniref:Uncharacterized protein n=1 Tax=Lipomyces kononenkoae TaxID=34357 RepID=A0ACC3T8X2_LIPKO
MRMTSIRQSWLNIPADSHFSLRNIPFGIISTASDPRRRPAVAIGDYALDLFEFSNSGGFRQSGFTNTAVFENSTLNAFAALGRAAHRMVRTYIQDIFAASGPYPDLLERNHPLRERALLPLASVQNHLPLEIGDYTDFFVGRNHAYNCGVIFRGPENALNPNYYHVPVGYHGRASSVVISGTPIKRPVGQILPDPTAVPKIPVLAPTQRLDYEVEFAAFIATGNNMGERINVNEAEEHIFGYVLMNDWSARDVQAWEYVPLGPFTAKNFGTSISAWVVLSDALEPFRTKPLARPAEAGDVLPYLQEGNEESVYDIKLQVVYQTAGGDKAVVSKGSTKYLLFSFAQMIAHHTVTGANLRPGDLIASGTISGEDSGSLGSLLEKSQAGKVHIAIGQSTRTFLQDGDTITITAAADDGSGAGLVGFGELNGTVLAPDY